MQSIKPGIAYKLFNFKSEEYQEVRFTEKVDGKYISGTTNEEVIEMMIDRFYQLNKKSFSSENQVVILLLKIIRQQLSKRLSRKIDNVKKYEQGEGERNTAEWPKRLHRGLFDFIEWFIEVDFNGNKGFNCFY